MINHEAKVLFYKDIKNIYSGLKSGDEIHDLLEEIIIKVKNKYNLDDGATLNIRKILVDELVKLNDDKVFKH